MLALLAEKPDPFREPEVIWGTAGIALVGVVFLNEGWDVLKGVALLMIIGGVIVLNLHGAH